MNKTQSTTFITVLLSAALFSTSCTPEHAERLEAAIAALEQAGLPVPEHWRVALERMKIVVKLAVISHQASQQQQAQAMARARKVSISKENQSRGVTRKAVVVKHPSGKGKGIIVVDSKTNKPVNDKVYVLKERSKSVEKGQVVELGDYEAEATDSLSA